MDARYWKFTNILKQLADGKQKSQLVIKTNENSSVTAWLTPEEKKSLGEQLMGAQLIVCDGSLNAQWKLRSKKS